MDMLTEKSPVLASLRPLVGRCRWVSFHPERLGPAVAQWGDLAVSLCTWSHPCHYFEGTEETIRWIFVLDTLNFCFWPDVGRPTWTVHYEGQAHSGYWGLAASLKRALEKGLRITDPLCLAELTGERLKEVFSGTGEIPLFEERLSNLREAGRVLLTRWQGDIVHLLEDTRGNAVQTAQQVVDAFPSFRDEAQYGDLRVLFWKRAQLFVADVYTAFSGSGIGCCKDIHRLTAFADYKLPQVLREMGILSYQPDLAERIDQRQDLVPGSEEEIEIRAMTLWAVEGLKEAFLGCGKEVTAVWVDHWLWQLGQLDPFRRKPYHRCRTIFY